jgi:P4 family phage/plasmid primase-like protien
MSGTLDAAFVDPPTARFAVTFFIDHAAQEKRQESRTMEALADIIRATSAAEKESLPWLKLARFGNTRTAKGSLRHDRNVIACSGVEADYDGEEISFAEAVEALEKAGIKAIVYTTPSHTDEAPHWRVLCPFSCEFPPDRREHMMGRLNGLFGGIFAFESWTLSQAYYFGAVNGNPGQVEIIDGMPLDLCHELDKIRLGKPDTKRVNGDGNGHFESGPVDKDALLAAIVNGEAYHVSCTRLLGRWAQQGVAFLDAQNRLYEAFDAVALANRDARWRARRADVPRIVLDIYGKEAERQDAKTAAPPDDATPPEFSDEALALEFAKRHADELRHVASLGTWNIWTGSYWCPDATMQAVDLARAVCRSASSLVPPKRERLAFAVASAKTVAAVERLARADRRHATPADQWDRDMWLFNANGAVTINLRTGEEYAARPADYITKISPVAPNSTCAITLWITFLEGVTSGDVELQRYLQRIAGYCMTGLTTEHALFFLYGSGGNGKSVFVNTLRGIWGAYAVVAPMETFVESHTDRHPTEIAHLHGARLVCAQETERGRRWAEAKIKALTGGDPITARFMRQDFFTFVPQFKLLISGNHKPALRGVNEAIRRRIQLVPFTVTILPAERDRDLEDKLTAEWPGILQWAIDGCREWQRIGLAPPPAVCEATEEYLQEQDGIAQWVEECCVTGKHLWGIGAQLWQSWKKWAEANNETPGARNDFSTALSELGYRPDKSQHVRGHRGINLKPSNHAGRADHA